MLTLLSFTCLLWLSCIFSLSYRYKLPQTWTTLLSVLLAGGVSVVVGMEEQYEPLWYLISLNVVLLSSLLVVYCYGNQEKLEWTATIERNMTNIFESLERNKHELSELRKSIK